MGGTDHFASRLISLIESDAVELTRRTIEILQTSSHTPAYRHLSFDALHGKVFDVYHQFGRWVIENTDIAIRTRYRALGEQRCQEGIPLHELLWALVLTKDYLRRHLSAWALADSALELYRQQELDRIVAQFFDRAMCYAAEGYEHARQNAERAEPVRVAIPNASFLAP